MAPRSKIHKLPAEIRNKIGELYDRGHTLDEILSALDGVDTSRSALGRYVKQRDQLADNLRRSREISDSLVRNLGHKTPGKQQALLIELFHTAILDLFLNQETGQISKDGLAALRGSPKNLAQLADAVHSLARANRLDVDVRADLERAAREAAERELRESVERQAQRQGLSADTVQALLSEAFGVKKS